LVNIQHHENVEKYLHIEARSQQ